jgi:hypothetical protein
MCIFNCQSDIIQNTRIIVPNDSWNAKRLMGKDMLFLVFSPVR